MKRFFAMLFMCVSMMMSFTSCEEDQKLAFELSGFWSGNMGMSYKDLNDVRWNSNDTEIYFNCFFQTKGDGYQVDFYTGGDYQAVFHKFTWDITDGVITIVYDDDRMKGFNARIYDYKLNSKTFEGYFGDSHEKFLLQRRDTFGWYDTFSKYSRATEYIKEFDY